MKNRNCFVSNSSSSSFVIISTKENIKESLDKLPKKVKKFIKDTFINSSRKVDIDGKEYLLYMGEYYTDDWPVYECTCGEEDYEKCKCLKENELWDCIKSFTNNVKPLAIIDQY
jgi:hypothetical protein